MLKSLVLGTILGGLAAFAWSTISWELVGWHERTMSNFKNDDEVASVIASHAPQSGTYILPSAPVMPGMSGEQKEKAEAALREKMQNGPIMVAAVRRGGFGSFSRAIILQALGLMAAAFLLTWLLLQTRGLSFGKRVLFLGVVGLAAGVIIEIPNWNWRGFSGAFTAVNIADSLLTWLLAGLVIAKVAKPAV